MKLSSYFPQIRAIAEALGIKPEGVSASFDINENVSGQWANYSMYVLFDGRACIGKAKSAEAALEDLRKTLEEKGFKHSNNSQIEEPELA
jgi:hypothetical protein